MLFFQINAKLFKKKNKYIHTNFNKLMHCLKKTIMH